MEQEKKKVLITVPYLYGGGAERVASIWANMLVEQNSFDVFMLTYFPLEREYYLNQKVNRYNVAKNKKEYLKLLHAGVFKKKSEILKNIKPDVIIPFIWHINITMVLVNKNKECVVYQTIRNNPKKSPATPLRRVARNIFIHKAGRLIVQNKEQADYYKSKRIKKYVVNNPLNPLSKLHIKNNYRKIKNIIAVGRLHKQKNYKFMIETMKHLIKSDKDITLSIFGEGQEKSKLLRLIEKNGLEKNIILKGNVKNIIEIYKNYDAFLMTSLYEGFPNALLEAMSIGVPVFVTNFKTGVIELVEHDVTGFIEYRNSPQNMAKMMLEKNNEKLLSTVGTTAREFVGKQYSNDKIVNQLLELFTHI